MRLTPLALAAGLLAGSGAGHGQVAQAVAAAASAPIEGVAALEASRELQPAPRGDAARQLPIVLLADRIQSMPDLETVAEGHVDFRRGSLSVSANRLGYDSARDLATARGQVRLETIGATYRGTELQLQIQRFEGYFLQPEFEFTQIGAGGRAERIDFFDSARSRALRAEYTSCPRDQAGEPAWVLRADSVSIDLEANEGVADGARLRFLGTPILALPRFSFALSDARKSGWLPPSVKTDNRNGVEVSVPYYWNIAPNRDATFTPRILSRRGLGIDSEVRYLEPDFEGRLGFDWLPNDRKSGRSREAVQWLHDGRLGFGLQYRADLVRVSDDDWWKDFPDAGRGVTPRLLPLQLALERPFAAAGIEGLVYARALQWQVLQGTDAVIRAPYERSPQLGMRLSGEAVRWVYALEAEYNRFTLPSGDAARAGRQPGERVHLLGSVSRPLRGSGWWLTPRLTVNAARYSDVGTTAPGATTHSGRVIPSFSIDTGFELERRTQAFGRALQQTLEPRLLYVRTPIRDQSLLPNYDAAAKDFNFVSIYTDNQFSGIDRVSDAHQLTAGVTTRFVDTASGVEALRLGLVQRYLFRTQRLTATAEGAPGGPPLETRFSDALLLGSTNVLPSWTLDAAVQYSPDLQRSVRSIFGARYLPGPFRTISTTYRMARGSSEQLEIGWQWPLAGPNRAAEPGRNRRSGSGSVDETGARSHNSCEGTWYTVGRFNYSLKDSRVTDSVLGLEYDAGCWIGRVVAERLSTGRSEATTRLMLQLELVGLSRLGSNPLKVLKDNIPGYRLLREERRYVPLTEDR